MTRPLGVFVLCALAGTIAAGCASTGDGPYSAPTARARNPLEAQRLTQEAAGCMDRDPDTAERLLRQALDADLFHGPAHNNLGVIYLARGELFAAASEFEWARKLLPGLPDPRLNLALTLERAGRTEDAVDEYRSALEVYPGHIETIQALTRCRLRHQPESRDDPEVAANLREIALRGESEEWKVWARERLATSIP